jgi:hypothetical protein
VLDGVRVIKPKVVWQETLEDADPLRLGAPNKR